MLSSPPSARFRWDTAGAAPIAHVSALARTARRALRSALLLSAVALAASAGAAAGREPGAALVLRNVTLIDATGRSPRPGTTVVVTAGRISAIGSREAIAIPEHAELVDGSGKFLIPGLWDMHTHWSRTEFLPLYIANGVTGIRLLRGLPVHQQWRNAVAKNELLAPHLVIASPLVDGPNPVHRDSITAGDADEGRTAVAKAVGGGADFIKVYSLLPRDAYFGIIDEAKRRNIPVAGHVPRAITTREASDAGQKSIEHLSGIAFACSRLQAELPADIAKLEAEAAAGASYLTLLRRLEGKHLDAYDARRCTALFARFRRNGTWHVPTLLVNRAAGLQSAPDFADPRRAYLPAAARSTNPLDHPVYKHFSAADYMRLSKNQAQEMRIVGAMQRAGVGILAGTDMLPIGFGLHDELALLVESGLTPMEALQAATRNPAAYLGQLDRFGTIEVGKQADLILLDADPLGDIRNTRKISAVVLGGRLFTRTELDRMLADVKIAADRP